MGILNSGVNLTSFVLTVLQRLNNFDEGLWTSKTIRLCRYLHLVIRIWSEISYLLAERNIRDSDGGIHGNGRLVVINFVAEHAFREVPWGLPRDLYCSR